jgi:hypothetical protein
MMSSLDKRYRQKSIECQTAAERAGDPSTRAMYWKLAKHWLELEEQAELLARAQTDYGQR